MNKLELKSIIREVVEVVMKDDFSPLGVAQEWRLDEAGPPGFPKKLRKQLITKYKKKYPNDEKRAMKAAFGTMWKIFYAKKKGHKKVNEIWEACERQDIAEISLTENNINEAIPDEDPNDPLYVEYLSDRQGEDPFMMNGTKWQYVNAKYPNGKKDLGVYSFAEDMVYGYNAFRTKFNLKEEKNVKAKKQEHPHDETDMNNPEEEHEVALAKKIKKIADELLAMHGADTETSEDKK